MSEEETEQLERVNAKRLVESAARFQMRKRDPRMLIIPEQRRNEGKCKGKQKKIESESLEFAPMPRDQREDEHDRDQLERVCVFTEKPDADQQSGGEPERVRIRSSLEREPEREHGRDPEKDRKRIDRHDEIADIEKRNGVE